LSKWNHWKNVSQHYHRAQPPLVPNQQIIEYFYHRVPESANALMLGVTPLIATSFNNITAIDKEPKMIETMWPGNTDTKKVINDDWLTVNLPNNCYDGILGDCSVNVLVNEQQVTDLFNRVFDWLTPQGYFVCRFFTRPDNPVTIEQLLSEAQTPTMNFPAFKRLLPSYIAQQQKDAWVNTRATAELFNELFPNRDNLPWDKEDLKTIDKYLSSGSTTWFPTRQEVFDLIPKTARNVRFVDVGDYDFAEYCPILEFTK